MTDDLADFCVDFVGAWEGRRRRELSIGGGMFNVIEKKNHVRVVSKEISETEVPLSERSLVLSPPCPLHLTSLLPK